jgi:hypothetical protein
LPDPKCVSWIGNRVSIGTRNSKRRGIRAIKKAKKVMASGVGKNKKFPIQVVVVIEFEWQLIGESGGLRAG